MRILIVEDEVKIANALKKGLELEHYAVDVAYDGDSGLAEALHEPYDLIVLDRMLPGSVDGMAILRRIKEEGIAAPVLFLTAKDALQDKVDGLNSGADDYLVKPFAFEELLARVKALLRRPATDVGIVLQIADLQLDTSSKIVQRAGQHIALSSKEFALLEYLMCHAGSIVSKEQIMQHVWNFDADILPNTVEVYIRYLRIKIETPFDGPRLIQTVRGFGYKMTDTATP